MVLQWGSLEHPEAEKYDSALYCRNPDTGLRKNCCNDKVLFDSEKKINLKPQERKVGYLFRTMHFFLP